MIGITTDGIVCGRLGRRLPKQVGKISQEFRGICDQQACRNLKSILRPNQTQPRQSEQNEGDQNLSGSETKLNEKEHERNESDSMRHLQRLHQRQMQMRTTASNPRELEGKTLEGENSM